MTYEPHPQLFQYTNTSVSTFLSCSNQNVSEILPCFDIAIHPVLCASVALLPYLFDNVPVKQLLQYKCR